MRLGAGSCFFDMGSEDPVAKAKANLLDYGCQIAEGFAIRVGRTRYGMIVAVALGVFFEFDSSA